jgi:hypothetical protein
MQKSNFRPEVASIRDNVPGSDLRLGGKVDGEKDLVEADHFLNSFRMS